MRGGETENIMTIKKSITTKTNESGRNSFSFNEKTGVLTLKIECEFSKTRTSLKAKHLSTAVGKEYKFIEAQDKDGNTIRLYKTGFDYEPVVKESKGLIIDPKKVNSLSTEEQSVLMGLLSKLA